MAISLCAGCISSKNAASKEASTENRTVELLRDYKQNNDNLTFNKGAWKYDQENNVYWQIQVSFCSTPETTAYETMGIMFQEPI